MKAFSSQACHSHLQNDLLYLLHLSDLKNVYYDILVFFSPSGIESLFSNFPDFKQNDTRIAVFGKNTANAAKSSGLRIDIEAPLNKIPSMSRALYLYIEKANKK